ncbi:MAG: hypothetical protein ACLQNU_00435 [Candidatus Dormibacteria bacterium]
MEHGVAVGVCDRELVGLGTGPGLRLAQLAISTPTATTPTPSRTARPELIDQGIKRG